GYLASVEHLWFATDKFVVRNSLTYATQYIDFGPFSQKTGRFNDYAFDPPTGDLSTPGRAGVAGAYSSQNFTQYSFNRRERIQYSPKATYFLDNLAGNHEISAGLDLAFLREDVLFGITGNAEYIDIKQVPFDSTSQTQNYYYIETGAPLRQKTSGVQTGLYLQDAWHPIEKLTVRGGARFDRGGLYNDQGKEVISYFAVSPRIYAAYDLTGDGKTVIRGGYGRFIDPGKLSQSDFLNRHGLSEKLFLGEYFGITDNGSGSMYFGTSGEATTLRARTITVPRQDAVRLGAERDVTHGIAVGLTWNAKWTTHLFEDDDANLIWNGSGNQTIGNRIGVVDNRFRIRTPGSARRYYQDLEFTVRRRFADQFELLGSYTWSRSLGTTPDSFSASLDNPAQDKYDFGYLPNDRTNAVRLAATYDFNFGFTMGTTLNYLSGPRYERHVWNDFADGYTNRTAPALHGGQLDGAPLWDLKFMYGPKLPGAWGKARAELTVLNVLNNRQIAGYQQSQYDARGVLYPAGRYEPLSIRLGGRYEF
ncbi:MAG TPA: hypothetical protein VMV18_09835, partial [bacterium]|nr:hypothetical protein [bacterium]